tara:strand:+ start:1520 stop:1864 length:345 start_codon:yes stop_codon:yes gene_type:complete
MLNVVFMPVKIWQSSSFLQGQTLFSVGAKHADVYKAQYIKFKKIVYFITQQALNAILYIRLIISLISECKYDARIYMLYVCMMHCTYDTHNIDIHIIVYCKSAKATKKKADCMA